MVEVNTTIDPKDVSPLYFLANTAAVEPHGIPISKTITVVSIISNFNNRQIAKEIIGITNSLNTLIKQTLANICLLKSNFSASIDPTRIKHIGVKLAPVLLKAVNIGVGIFIFNAKKTIAITIARNTLFKRKFTIVSLIDFFLEGLKILSPAE